MLGTPFLLDPVSRSSLPAQVLTLLQVPGRHVWVGSGGALIDVMGTRTNGVMRMEGTIEYVGLNSVLAFRGTWTELPDGRVRQLFEEFDIGLGNWQVWFDGYYTLAQTP